MWTRAICDATLVQVEFRRLQEWDCRSQNDQPAYHDSLFMARICPTTMISFPVVAASPSPGRNTPRHARLLMRAVLAETLCRLPIARGKLRARSKNYEKQPAIGPRTFSATLPPTVAEHCGGRAVA